eukprot:CAMPEP_0203665012 /NCGR_PEP_ID=MMETSP0090-20130426/2307_1 /ASSEMBLY_ACC=CAM_ASM_001088 /TAXON_ID=426623 /ORGANISM="Chaetoceros affinis, Strain CCMP159" /LENGTH=571 /DNA_ID=CAMNT_0050528443 /DNA_START=124 /DNA_END=1839 /DNA_ORIENTATION=-
MAEPTPTVDTDQNAEPASKRAKTGSDPKPMETTTAVATTTTAASAGTSTSTDSAGREFAPPRGTNVNLNPNASVAAAADASATVTAITKAAADATSPSASANASAGDNNSTNPPPPKNTENQEQDDAMRRSEASVMLTNFASHAGMPNMPGMNVRPPQPHVNAVFDPEVHARTMNMKPSDAATENEDDPENAYNMSQSERKRYREKKRRQNISAAIDQLTKILLRVDPVNFIEHNNQVYFASERGTINNSNDPTFRKRRSSTSRAPTTSHHHQPLNRTEIITHAALLIERLAEERDGMNMKIMQVQHMSSNGDGNGNTAGAPNANNGAPSISMVSPFPMQQQAPQMMMVSNGMSQSGPTAILMQPNPYGIPQYIVNGPAPPGWPVQQQQHVPTFIAPPVSTGAAPNVSFVNNAPPTQAPAQAGVSPGNGAGGGTETESAPGANTASGPGPVVEPNAGAKQTAADVPVNNRKQEDNMTSNEQQGDSSKVVEPIDPANGNVEQPAGADIQNEESNVTAIKMDQQKQEDQQSSMNTNSATATKISEGSGDIPPPQSHPKDSGQNNTQDDSTMNV